LQYIAAVVIRGECRCVDVRLVAGRVTDETIIDHGFISKLYHHHRRFHHHPHQNDPSRNFLWIVRSRQRSDTDTLGHVAVRLSTTWGFLKRIATAARGVLWATIRDRKAKSSGVSESYGRRGRLPLVAGSLCRLSCYLSVHLDPTP
jgi:hypothetical protein